MASDTAYTANEIAAASGITKRAIMKRAQKENWPHIIGNGNGGAQHEYPLPSLPPDVQKAIVARGGVSPAVLPVLSPEAALAALEQMLPVPSPADASTPARPTWTPETAISEDDLRDPRIRKILAVLREVEDMPRTWTKGKRKWIEAVALRHDVQWQSIYRWMKKYDKRGIAGLRHSKSTAGRPKAWTPEAVDFWLGLCLKKEHRKIDRKDLYHDVLVIEAHRRAWKIGGYESANWWFDKRVTPQLLALQKGGVRALDNVLPPILRDYSDLAPFEILVGDQHRFDFWVVDDDTGDVFRPEGYLWQDLRTRIIYGAALDKKYDAWLIGLALRIGIRLYGAFGSIYTDNGKPELSRYLTGILADFQSLGFAWERTVDVPMDILDTDEDNVNPGVVLPGTHRKAIVKNAKAKMIEGTFHYLEAILRSHFRLPGSVKCLTASPEEQEQDHKEALALAAQGKLLLFSEFVLTLYRALDYYNRERAHRGVLREWAWKPKPAAATPLDCLRTCYQEGWRPRRLSEEALDLIFLARASRTIHQGRISFQNGLWEHDALGELHGQTVNVRYNPMTTDELYIFHGRKYLCTALPVEYSSMVNEDLAARKIEEKRSRRRRYIEDYRCLTTVAPDFREYSQVPALERAAALIGADKRKRADEQREFNRSLTQAELDEHIAKMEQGLPLPAKTRTVLPERPAYFLDEFSRFEWTMNYIRAGGELAAEDEAFRDRYMAALREDQREYWTMYCEYGGR